MRLLTDNPPAFFRRHVAPNGAGYIVAGLIVVLLVAGASVSDRFSTLSNLLNIHQQSTGLALVALGQTLAVLTGGIDLSVGSLISVTATLTSGLSDSTQGAWQIAIAAALGLSIVVGLLNGLLVLWLRVHPLIVTLGMGAVLQGGILYYANGPAGAVPDGFDALAYGRYANLPVTATIVLLLYVAMSYFMRNTRLGRYVYLVGDDDNAATLAGIPRKRVILFVYTFSAFCAGLTGVYLAAQFGSGQPYLGANYTLASITPVVVGGTILSGGRGGVIGTLLGVYLLSMLNNLINFAGVPSQYQLIVQGIAIIAAVCVNVQQKRRIA
ncbi:ABC transporter permease [Paraburkholderia rhizosphaerae]|uniref:Monosaccharide ABC transporter membrane protein (CUT2 family) n=1 Tax=Paraburkholderia rhizosphaerae TaxID=480658 RepID=A0A4R8LLN7_9BURK|nr:ABC transporter permease [Paraburkholderia rhizosphaerae]TDY43819.1 monosaccharide ABC transporter membrane protein (CUT2 family) [Paraburkholderia rhizosphaerae]